MCPSKPRGPEGKRRRGEACVCVCVCVYTHTHVLTRVCVRAYVLGRGGAATLAGDFAILRRTRVSHLRPTLMANVNSYNVYTTCRHEGKHHNKLNNAMTNFRHHHPFLAAVARQVVRSYDPNSWVSAGPLPASGTVLSSDDTAGLYGHIPNHAAL